MFKNLMIKLGLIKPIPRMFTRLENLYKYSMCVNFNTNKLEEMDRKPCQISFLFHTNLGDVQIKLSNIQSLCSSEISTYYFDYCNYAGFHFRVSATQEKVNVHPLMGEHLTAETVDLAILELEEHLQEVFGDPNFLIKQKLEQKQVELDNHMKELAKLV